MIASGKSLYASNAAAAGAVIVNDDAIVNAVHGGDYKLYSKSLKPLYKTIENTLLSVAIAMGRPVIVDRGVNISEQSRLCWIGLAAALEVECIAVEFDKATAEVHAKRRFITDRRGHDQKYWLQVAAHHDSIYEPPLLAEGFAFISNAPYTHLLKGYGCDSTTPRISGDAD